MSLPQIVDEQQWRESNAALIEKEKAATRAGDALAAERRRQPMMAFDTGFQFDGPSGRVSFLDLFDGRPQLVLYHFWFPEDGEPCGGCSMFTDQVTHLAHLHARGVSFTLVSRAPQERIAAYEKMVAALYEKGKALNAGSLFEVDEVIDPAETRRWIVAGLRSLPPSPVREGKRRPCVDGW